MDWLKAVVTAPLLVLALGLQWLSYQFPTHVNDLAFVAVEPFHATKDDDPMLMDQYDNLLVRFRSDQNLRRLAKDSDAYSLHATISLCPFHDNPSLAGGYVTHNGVELDTRPMRVCAYHSGQFDGCGMTNDTPEVRAEVASESETKGPFFYEVRFGYSGQWLAFEMPHGGWTQRQIPLPPEPQDLCVKITGAPPRLVSNVFVIPKADLVRALGNTPLSPAKDHS